jgi:hypothetical protein
VKLKAEEIREWHKTFEHAVVTAEVARARARIEIAAQLAELNENFERLIEAVNKIGYRI